MPVAHRRGYLDDGDRRVTDRVLDALAKRETADPATFDPPLYDVVDPDALDALFRRESATMAVEFTYRGYRVSVSGDGEVAVAVSELEGKR